MGKKTEHPIEYQEDVAVTIHGVRYSLKESVLTAEEFKAMSTLPIGVRWGLAEALKKVLGNCYTSNISEHGEEKTQGMVSDLFKKRFVNNILPAKSDPQDKELKEVLKTANAEQKAKILELLKK